MKGFSVYDEPYCLKKNHQHENNQQTRVTLFLSEIRTMRNKIQKVNTRESEQRESVYT